MKFPLPLKLSALAAMLHAKPVGDPDFPVTGMNEIHMVESGDLTFVDHPKYYSKALNSLQQPSSSTKKWIVLPGRHCSSVKDPSMTMFPWPCGSGPLKNPFP